MAEARITLQSADGLDTLERSLRLRPGEPITIGRSSATNKELSTTSTNGYIESPVISRKHATLTYDDTTSPPSVGITDNTSTHGTCLNGEKLLPDARYVIKQGDQLTFGQTVYRDKVVFAPRTYTCRFTLQEASFPTSFAVPEDESSEDEVEIILSQDPSYGSEANPVNLDDNESNDDIELADVTIGVQVIHDEPACKSSPPGVQSSATDKEAKKYDEAEIESNHSSMNEHDFVNYGELTDHVDDLLDSSDVDAASPIGSGHSTHYDSQMDFSSDEEAPEFEEIHEKRSTAYPASEISSSILDNFPAVQPSFLYVYDGTELSTTSTNTNSGFAKQPSSPPHYHVEEASPSIFADDYQPKHHEQTMTPMLLGASHYDVSSHSLQHTRTVDADIPATSDDQIALVAHSRATPAPHEDQSSHVQYVTATQTSRMLFPGPEDVKAPAKTGSETSASIELVNAQDTLVASRETPAVPCMVEETAQLVSPPASSIISRKRKADVLEEATIDGASETSSVLKQIARVTKASAATIPSRGSRKRLRSTIAGATKAAAYLVSGAAISISILTQLPPAFWEP